MCSGVMGGEGRGVPFCRLGTPPHLQDACALRAGLQGAPPAHFAEGEAETRKDWDIRLDAGRLGVGGHTDLGSDVPRLTPMRLLLPQCPRLRGWGPDPWLVKGSALCFSVWSCTVGG